MLTTPTYTGQGYSGRKRIRPARTRRSAPHPLGTLAQGGDPLPPEAWPLVATIPAVVSQEHFAHVHTKFLRNQQQASRNNKTHASLLRALVRCGTCQACCIARTPTGGCATMGVGRRSSPALRSPDSPGGLGISQPSSWKHGCGTLFVRCCNILRTSPMRWRAPRGDTGCRRNCRRGKQHSATGGSTSLARSSG
jgi:hypothetical protein